MKKTNIKRAMKTLDKHAYGCMYYERLQTAGHKVLVSNGHVVITLSETDFEENKQYCKSKFVENDKLSSVALDVNNAEDCRPTTVSILVGDKQTRVMKSKNGLCVVNAEYLQALEDVGCSMIFAVNKPNTEEIRTPMVECVVDPQNNVFHCNAILPINTNVRDVLEHVLGC